MRGLKDVGVIQVNRNFASAPLAIFFIVSKSKGYALISLCFNVLNRAVGQSLSLVDSGKNKSNVNVFNFRENPRL